jgi:hypothetical protein
MPQECLATLEGSPGSATYAAALESLRSASMNCYDFDVFAAGSFEATSSLLQQKLRFADVRIADPCTYRLIYKNATTLTQSAELVGAAGAQLDEVIRWGTREWVRAGAGLQQQRQRHGRQGSGVAQWQQQQQCPPQLQGDPAAPCRCSRPQVFPAAGQLPRHCAAGRRRGAARRARPAAALH